MSVVNETSQQSCACQIIPPSNRFFVYFRQELRFYDQNAFHSQCVENSLCRYLDVLRCPVNDRYCYYRNIHGSPTDFQRSFHSLAQWFLLRYLAIYLVWTPRNSSLESLLGQIRVHMFSLWPTNIDVVCGPLDQDLVTTPSSVEMLENSTFFGMSLPPFGFSTEDTSSTDNWSTTDQETTTLFLVDNNKRHLRTGIVLAVAILVVVAVIVVVAILVMKRRKRHLQPERGNDAEGSMRYTSSQDVLKSRENIYIDTKGPVENPMYMADIEPPADKSREEPNYAKVNKKDKLIRMQENDVYESNVVNGPDVMPGARRDGYPNAM